MFIVLCRGHRGIGGYRGIGSVSLCVCVMCVYIHRYILTHMYILTQTAQQCIYRGGYIVGVYKDLFISLNTLGWCQSLGSTRGIATTIFRLYMPYISTSPTPIYVTIQNPQKAFFVTLV